MMSIQELEVNSQFDLMQDKINELKLKNQELRNKLLNFNRIGIAENIIEQIF